MFVAIFFFFVVVFSFLFLLMPLVNGMPLLSKKNFQKQNPLHEEAQNLKQNLEDIENELKIGKISESDYLKLRNEILAEWQKIYQKENVTKHGS